MGACARVCPGGLAVLRERRLRSVRLGYEDVESCLWKFGRLADPGRPARALAYRLPAYVGIPASAVLVAVEDLPDVRQWRLTFADASFEPREPGEAPADDPLGGYYTERVYVVPADLYEDRPVPADPEGAVTGAELRDPLVRAAVAAVRSGYAAGTLVAVAEAWLAGSKDRGE